LLAEIWRGDMVESRHLGHAVVVDEAGQVIAAWGDPDAMIYPRSSVKMLQALPLVESGAAAAAGLGSEQLALACASHNGAQIHTGRVRRWLDLLGLGEADLRCGPQVPDHRPARLALRETGAEPCQLHNNCSGKHAGFLTLNRHLQGGGEYIEPEHPVQMAVLEAFEAMTEQESPGFGIDGCSAPNHACTVAGVARAMAKMAAPDRIGGARGAAAEALVSAMAAHPLLIAGEGRACSELGAAAGGRAVVKTGAEGVFVGILPEQRIGIALKVSDGATRASEAAMAALLVRMGVLDADDPAVRRRMRAEIRNRRDVLTGYVTAAPTLLKV